jgi:hypothetical protein
MRRNGMMTSLMAIGGITFAVMQMMRMRNRNNSMWTNMVHWANDATGGTMRGMNQVMRTARRRVRM